MFGNKSLEITIVIEKKYFYSVKISLSEMKKE